MDTDKVLTILKPLRLLRYFPSDCDLVDLMAANIAQWTDDEDAVRTLVARALKEWTEWKSYAELRELFLYVAPMKGTTNNYCKPYLENPNLP